MKAKFLILFIFIYSFFTSDLYSQNKVNIAPDSRLYECFDSSYIQQMQINNPSLLSYYNFYLDNSFYVVSLQKPKPVTGEDIHKITLNEDLSKGQSIYFNETIYNSEKFNVLKYAFKTQDINFTTYIWKEANIAIVFLPRKKITEEYQKYIKAYNIQ
jgi:hypothetical protein